MNQIVLTGMVLSTTPVGEYDRRVVLLTKEQGKVSAFAKGSRRPNSPLVGVVNPFTFGEFTMYEGRSSYTIQSAKVINYFSELREDVLGAYYGFYFLEVANYYAREFNIYELKILTINGQGPQVFQCVNCGNKAETAVFSAGRGGLVCETCAGEVRDGIRLASSTLYSMQYIESSKVEHLYTFNVKPEILQQLSKVTERLMGLYVDRKFKSLEILETLL